MMLPNNPRAASRVVHVSVLSLCDMATGDLGGTEPAYSIEGYDATDWRIA